MLHKRVLAVAPQVASQGVGVWRCWAVLILALALAGLLALLGGCAARERVPDWQIEAAAAQERATRADLEGRTRVAELEWQRAWAAAQRTAQAEPLARLALSRCAVAQAALDFAPCTLAQPLLAHASAAEQAYARYLQAQPLAADVALLPAVHQVTARALLAAAAPAPGAASTQADAALPALRAIDDPLARLVAASVWLRAGMLSPAALELALQTASAQGWRRPLLAWLLLQERLATQAGNAEQAKQARLRLLWLQGQLADQTQEPTPVQAPAPEPARNGPPPAPAASPVQ